MTDLKITVTGAAGRMGQTLIQYIQSTDGCTLTGATEAPGHEALGQDAGRLAGLEELGVSITDNIDGAFAASDAVIDFTLPKATQAHVKASAAQKMIHIIGTTGLSAAQEDAIAHAAATATIIKSGNMSLGVNVLSYLTQQVAHMLDENFDIEVLEMHHRHKVDAPSGTALMLGDAAAQGRDVALSDVADRGRDGHTGPRAPGDIGFAVLRGGGVVGDHSVIFASETERLELTHKAHDRGIFAQGAIKAALWGRTQSPGLYSMMDVLGLST